MARSSSLETTEGLIFIAAYPMGHPLVKTSIWAVEALQAFYSSPRVAEQPLGGIGVPVIDWSMHGHF
jgi:hypothetical protein